MSVFYLCVCRNYPKSTAKKKDQTKLINSIRRVSTWQLAIFTYRALHLHRAARQVLFLLPFARNGVICHRTKQISTRGGRGVSRYSSVREVRREQIASSQTRHPNQARITREAITRVSRHEKSRDLACVHAHSPIPAHLSDCRERTGDGSASDRSGPSTPSPTASTAPGSTGCSRDSTAPTRPNRPGGRRARAGPSSRVDFALPLFPGDARQRQYRRSRAPTRLIVLDLLTRPYTHVRHSAHARTASTQLNRRRHCWTRRAARRRDARRDKSRAHAQ